MEDELWAIIEEFPQYKISSRGLVLNIDTGRVISQSYNPQGAKKVGLFDGVRQHTRSVKFLVASAFVPGETEVNDTAINLDGNQDNNDYSNLMWRPRWFALRYTRQFRKIDPWYLGRKIEDVATGILYPDMVDAAIEHGLLLDQIILSIHNEQDVCFPTWQKFKFME